MNNEYELGSDVTEKARGKTSRQSSVLSVRLSNVELARLDSIARLEGRSIAQVVRDAIAGYVVGTGQGYITVSQKVTTMTTGEANFTVKGGVTITEDRDLAVTVA
jgi:hypothetical protein